MKTPTPTLKQTMAQLEAWGSEGFRRTYAKMGAGDNQFGVQMGKLRGLAKTLKKQHALALELWATENQDARMLASMIFDPSLLSKAEMEKMLKPLTYPRLADEFVDNVVLPSPYAAHFREKWIDSPNKFLGRAAWNLMREQVDLDPAPLDLDAILTKIEAEMKSTPRPKQDAMNYCLVKIAIQVPALRPRCLAIAEKLGRLNDDPVSKGCTSSYAPEWIAAVLRRK